MDALRHANYCPMFFKGMYLERRDSVTLSQGHCCSSGQGNLVKAVDFDHYAMFVHNRSNWSKEKTSGCEPCWLPERNQHHSFRLGYVDWLAKQPHCDPLHPELLKLDYNVGPLCNAKCLHCSATWSSAWAAEDAKYGASSALPIFFSDTVKNDVVSQINVDRLQVLYLNGGEPFLSVDMPALLHKVKAQGNIANLKFQSNTNGSIRPSDEIIDLWMQCAEVDIFVSLDAIEQQFEYIRYPLQWTTVLDNIEFLCGLSDRIKVTFSIAMGVHNVDEIQRTWQWFQQHRQRRNQQQTQFGIHRVYGTLDLMHSSQQLRDTWLDQLDPTGYWTPWVRTLITHGEPGNDTVWLEYLQMIDQRRGLDWRHSLPELASSLKKSTMR